MTRAAGRRGPASRPATQLAVPHAWQTQAHCDERTLSDAYHDRKWAKSVCLTSCLVREDCLLHAVSVGAAFGVWGGHDLSGVPGRKAARQEAKLVREARTRAAELRTGG